MAAGRDAFDDFADRLRQMRGTSKFSIETALRIAAEEGVGGTVTIHIPPQAKALLEAEVATDNPAVRRKT